MCIYAKKLQFYRLLKSGADINSRHVLGWGAIHAAVVNKAMRSVLPVCTVLHSKF